MSTEPVPGFSPGDKVWPTEGPMILQAAPQTVIATCRHPVAGDWLWLDDGWCGFRSFAATYWTTQEPDEAEKAARMARVAQRAAENAALAGFEPIPPVPVDDPMQQYEQLRKRRGEGMYTPLRAMLTPEALRGMCGDPIKDGCQHVMTGGCPLACFRGPCRFERAGT